METHKCPIANLEVPLDKLFTAFAENHFLNDLEITPSLLLRDGV
jgi:hypothetical protein